MLMKGGKDKIVDEGSVWEGSGAVIGREVGWDEGAVVDLLW